MLRYRRRGVDVGSDGAAAGGTLPGVVLGALVRVFVVPEGTVFRLLVAALMLPLGFWLMWRARPARPPPTPWGGG